MIVYLNFFGFSNNFLYLFFPNSLIFFFLSLFPGHHIGHHVSRAACWVARDLGASCEASAAPAPG